MAETIRTAPRQPLETALDLIPVGSLFGPEDVAVLGFDNDEIAAYLRPGLTTLALPHEEMGRRAVELAAGASSRIECRPPAWPSKCWPCGDSRKSSQRWAASGSRARREISATREVISV